jgi:hypothetical protein
MKRVKVKFLRVIKCFQDHRPDYNVVIDPDTRHQTLSSLTQLFPGNKVSLVRSSGNYVNVSVYSNQLELAEQVEEMMGALGCATKASLKYQVRLSKDVPAFLNLVNPLKA